MKFGRPFLWIVLALPLMIAAPSLVHAESFATGKDWTKRMTKKEKFLAVFAPYILYHRYGVEFRKPPQEYISDIDNVLMVNPYLEIEDVANIFASTVYTLEPESRPAFHAAARAFEYQNLAGGELTFPKVLLAPSATDIQESSAQ
jgi:hypothetical protein